MNRLKSSPRFVWCFGCLLTLILLFDGCVAFRSGSKNVASLSDSGTPVRILGVDTEIRSVLPSHAGDFCCYAAENFTNRLLSGRSFYLVKPSKKSVETDEFGQLLRYIHLEDGRDLGAELIRAGWARADERIPHPRIKEYRKLESEARKARIGIWSEEYSTLVGSLER